MSIIQLKSALLYDSNIYLLIGSEKTALIDAGTGFSNDAYVAELRSLLGGRPLDLIIITHRHYDHVGGLAPMQDAFSPSEICAGEADAVPLRSGDSESTLGTKFGGSIRPTDVRGLSDGEVIDLGGHRLRVIETPGHTSGSISLLDEATSSLFSGDCFFVDGVGRTDLPTASAVQMRSSLDRLTGIEFTALYPGHGPFVKNDAKRFLDKAIRLLEE